MRWRNPAAWPAIAMFLREFCFASQGGRCVALGCCFVAAGAGRREGKNAGKGLQTGAASQLYRGRIGEQLEGERAGTRGENRRVRALLRCATLQSESKIVLYPCTCQGKGETLASMCHESPLVLQPVHPVNGSGLAQPSGKFVSVQSIAQRCWAIPGKRKQK